MTITVNGDPRSLPDPTTLLSLLTDSGNLRGFAAAVDGEVVPRSQWPTFHLRDGARVELLTAMQGG